MPNRVIKDSIKRNAQIDSLTWFDEVVFYRLMVTVDDYGCYDGRTIVLRNDLFPTKDNITKKSIEDAISNLVSAGLLRKYTVNGMPYVFFPTWDKHQRIRNKVRKFPEPPKDILTADCSQMSANCTYESESNPNPNPNPNPNVCAEPASGSAPVISLPLNDGTEYSIYQEQCHEWAGLYPAVDVIQQLRAMRGWLLSNPTKRKTKRGIERFITGWLSREQDKGYRPKGGLSNSQSRPSAPDDVKADMERMQRYLQKQREESGNGV